MKDLEKRIKQSQEVIKSYPEWVRKSMIFHGGGVRRSEPKEKNK